MLLYLQSLVNRFHDISLKLIVGPCQRSSRFRDTVTQGITGIIFCAPIFALMKSPVTPSSYH